MTIYILTQWFEYEGNALWNPKEWETKEGYVLRLADSFSYREFRTSVGKFVRKNHVQTIKHWMFGQAMEKNELEK